MNLKTFSFRSRFRSFKFAFNGLLSLLKNEHNSRIHLAAAIVAISLGFILYISILEWCLIIFSIGFVFSAELLNSSLETLADTDNDWNENKGKAKDYSAAAVLVSAIVSAIIGGLIFIPKILALI